MGLLIVQPGFGDRRDAHYFHATRREDKVSDQTPSWSELVTRGMVEAGLRAESPESHYVARRFQDLTVLLREFLRKETYEEIATSGNVEAALIGQITRFVPPLWDTPCFSGGIGLFPMGTCCINALFPYGERQFGNVEVKFLSYGTIGRLIGLGLAYYLEGVGGDVEFRIITMHIGIVNGGDRKASASDYYELFSMRVDSGRCNDKRDRRSEHGVNPNRWFELQNIGRHPGESKFHPLHPIFAGGWETFQGLRIPQPRYEEAFVETWGHFIKTPGSLANDPALQKLND